MILNKEQFALAVLHKHWLTANSVNYQLKRVLTLDDEKIDGMDKSMIDFGRVLSTFAVLSVWYSLLYVVIEGYEDCDYRCADLDQLLDKGDYKDQLRRFRNATFHSQENPLSPKVMSFLLAEDSESWIRDVDLAFKGFFENRLDMRNEIERLNVVFQSAKSKA